VNGGKKLTPTILDRVQDGQGNTIYRHGQACESCRIEDWTGAPPPELPDVRETVMDPVLAYQVTYMLKGVVDNGTGRSISVLGRPLGGKTGTTNDYKDAWFMGFSPDLVTGVYVGYDNPKPLAGEAGGTVAAPIFRDFMEIALKDEPIVPFRIPEGVTLVPVNKTTGEPSYIGAPDFILEAFRAGTEPRLGDLSSTIRVGGGRDSFFGGGIDFGDEDTGDTNLDSRESSGEDASLEDDSNGVKPLGEASIALRDAADRAEAGETSEDGNGPSETEDTGNSTDMMPPAGENEEALIKPVAVPAERINPAPTQPEAEADLEPEEDELDDGLY